MTARHNAAPAGGLDPSAAEAQVAARLVAVLEACWRAIRRHHPEIPPAMLVVAAGFDARRHKLGHFAAERWRHARKDGALPEVLIGGEGLERRPEPVFATLLHEAAHALAHAREIQDTTRQGRYHNLRFRALAEELGLVVTPAPGIGWSATTLPAATAALYRRGDRRAPAGAHRLSPRRADRRPRRRSNNNPQPATCACPRRIRPSGSNGTGTYAKAPRSPARHAFGHERGSAPLVAEDPQFRRRANRRQRAGHTATALSPTGAVVSESSR
jgi:hypothetical protein